MVVMKVNILDSRVSAGVNWKERATIDGIRRNISVQGPDSSGQGSSDCHCMVFARRLSWEVAMKSLSRLGMLEVDLLAASLKQSTTKPPKRLLKWEGNCVILLWNRILCFHALHVYC
jgi:hypothetical protein